MPSARRAVEQQAQLLVEHEHRRVLAALDGRERRSCSASSDLPVPAGPMEQRAGAALEAAAQQRVELGDAAADGVAGESRPVLGRDQPREHAHAAVLDHEIVVAAAERLPAELHHPQAPALGAVVRRQLLQPDHAMGDAVHGLVVRLGGQVVEHQHGRAVLAK